MKGRRLTPVGAVLFVLLAVGVVLAIVGSSSVQVVGWVTAAVTLAALLYTTNPDAQNRYLPRWGGRTVAWTPPQDDSQAEYIEEAGKPSEAVWEREESRYKERLASEDSTD